MSTREVAEKLVSHCKNETTMQGLDELYSDDAVSVEAHVPEGMDPVTRGREAIRGKHEWWDANFDVHETKIEGPFINGDQFAVTFAIDATDKNSGQRWQMTEVGLYEVSNDKIVRESFYMPPMDG